ncbi:ATP-binding protein [Halobacteriales archaeon Cl-PHB]
MSPGGALAVRSLLAVEAAVLGLVAAYAYRRRGAPGARPFVGVAGAVALAALGLAVTGGVGATTSLVWTVLSSLMLVFVTCWLWFVAAYTGETGGLAARHSRLLASVPAVGVLTLGALYLSGRPIPRTLPLGDPLYVAVFTVPTVLVAGLFVAGTALLARSAVRYVSASRPRTLSLVVGALGATLLPTVVSPSLGGDYVLSGFAVAYGCSAAGFGLAAGWYDLFETGPITEAIGRDRLVAEIDDLVLVADGDDRVVDLNAAAASALATSREAAVGRDLEALLGVAEPPHRAETVEIATDEGRRSYEASVSAIEADGGQVVGDAVVLRDVTDRETRRQRLQVLNRVLRHNLRNDMTTVMGYAKLVADDRDGDDELLDRIRHTADALAELGDKAREIERIMAATTADEATDAARLVQYVAEEAEKTYPDTDVTVDLTGEVTVDAAEEVLWPVVWNLVENAIEHHDGDAPQVTISVAPADADHATVVVADDGPGIPVNERKAISEGEEQPLSHGSGLGLWAVKWGVNRVGGEVAFEPNEPRGSRVTVRLPLADAPAADRSVADPTEAA